MQIPPTFDISGWDTHHVTTMSNMFRGAVSFSHPVGSWDTHSVINMAGMFESATVFDQPITEWVMSGVTNTSFMYARSLPPLGRRPPY